MYADFHTHAPTPGVVNILFLSHGPTIVSQPLVGRQHHFSHELPLFHESCAKSLSTGPGLRTSAVEVDTVDMRSNKG